MTIQGWNEAIRKVGQLQGLELIKEANGWSNKPTLRFFELNNQAMPFTQRVHIKLIHQYPSNIYTFSLDV